MRLETLNTRMTIVEDMVGNKAVYVVRNKVSNEIIQNVKMQTSPSDINGLTVNDLLLICIDKVDDIQDSDEASFDGELLLGHLKNAANVLKSIEYERILESMELVRSAPEALAERVPGGEGWILE